MLIASKVVAWPLVLFSILFFVFLSPALPFFVLFHVSYHPSFWYRQNQPGDSPHISKRYLWHLLQQLPLTYNKSLPALLVFLVLGPLDPLPPVPTPGLRLCLYSTAICSNTSTANMFSFSLGLMRSLTYAKANWSLGLNASISLNNRQENRLLLSPCFLRIKALSGTSAKYQEQSDYINLHEKFKYIKRENKQFFYGFLFLCCSRMIYVCILHLNFDTRITMYCITVLLCHLRVA